MIAWGVKGGFEGDCEGEDAEEGGVLGVDKVVSIGSGRLEAIWNSWSSSAAAAAGSGDVVEVAAVSSQAPGPSLPSSSPLTDPGVDTLSSLSV